MMQIFSCSRVRRKKGLCPSTPNIFQMELSMSLKYTSEVAQSCLTLCEPWTVAYQAPPSMGFSRQEYWSGVPFPSPGDLPDSGIKPGSPAFQAYALTSEPPGKPLRYTHSLAYQTRCKVTLKLFFRSQCLGSSSNFRVSNSGWVKALLFLSTPQFILTQQVLTIALRYSMACLE